jgi:hypothetical protein
MRARGAAVVIPQQKLTAGKLPVLSKPFSGIQRTAIPRENFRPRFSK